MLVSASRQEEVFRVFLFRHYVIGCWYCRLYVVPIHSLFGESGLGLFFGSLGLLVGYRVDVHVEFWSCGLILRANWVSHYISLVKLVDLILFLFLGSP